MKCSSLLHFVHYVQELLTMLTTLAVATVADPGGARGAIAPPRTGAIFFRSVSLRKFCDYPPPVVICGWKTKSILGLLASENSTESSSSTCKKCIRSYNIPWKKNKFKEVIF
jgi:hypothetical protein